MLSPVFESYSGVRKDGRSDGTGARSRTGVAPRVGPPRARVTFRRMHSREVTSLGRARREFLRKESPWAIGAGILALIVARLVAGDLSWRDVVAVAAMVAIYPFGEWAIHVYLLHAKPFLVRGRKVDTM